MVIKDCSLFDNNYLFFIKTHFEAYDIGFINVPSFIEAYVFSILFGRSVPQRSVRLGLLVVLPTP